jgi:hypothetical protein
MVLKLDNKGKSSWNPPCSPLADVDVDVAAPDAGIPRESTGKSCVSKAESGSAL